MKCPSCNRRLKEYIVQDDMTAWPKCDERISASREIFLTKDNDMHTNIL